MRKYLPIFLIIFSSVFLAGCEAGDSSLAIGFIQSWLQSKGVVNENGNPTVGAIKYVGSGGFVSSGNKETDEIIDAGQVVKSIKEADEKASEAKKDLDKNPPDYTSAQTNLDAAVSKHPDDWYLRSQKGVLLLETGKSKEAEEYLSTASSSCDPAKNINMTQMQMERCMKQLQTEANFMAQANVRTGRTGNMKSCELLSKQSQANTQLAALASDLNYSQDNIDSYRQTAESTRGETNCK